MPRIAIVVCLLALLSGCSLNDPNRNGKVRNSMASVHAGKVLSDAGSSLKPYHPDYDLMIFGRRHYDESTTTLHLYTLYDFLKVSPEPGPDHFVIAYDKATRKTYLRSDLRSNENMDSGLARSSGKK